MWPSQDPEMFEIHSHILHGAQSSHGHLYDFSTHFDAPDLVILVQILIIHIVCVENSINV
jgi:hypothetical protein